VTGSVNSYTAEPVTRFETPNAAWDALVETLTSGEWSAVEDLLGPASAFVPPAARTREQLKKTAKDLGSAAVKIDVQGDQAAFVIGGRTFPLGATKTEKGWVLGDNPKAREEQAAMVKVIRCLSNLKAIHLAALQYEAKHKKMPAKPEALINAKETELPFTSAGLQCPFVAEKRKEPAKSYICDYIYIPLKADAPKTAILAFCPRGNHPGAERACVFMDGRAENIKDDKAFQAALEVALKAVGLSVDALKVEKTEYPEGSPAGDVEWRKMIRRELGLNQMNKAKTKAPTEKKSGKAKSSG
jgi:hypothetical protein